MSEKEHPATDEIDDARLDTLALASSFETTLLPDWEAATSTLEDVGDQEDDRLERRGELHALTAFALSHYFFLGAITPFLALYFESLSIAVTMIGLLVSIHTLARMIGPYLWSHLADQSGKNREVLIFTSWLAFFWTLWLPWIETPLALGLVLLAVFGANSAHMPLTDARIILAARGDWGRYGRIRGLGSIGFVAGMLTSGALLEAAGQFVYPWMAILLTLNSVWLAARLPKRKTLSRSSDTAMGVAGYLLRPQLLCLLAGCLLITTAHAAYYALLAIYLISLGFSELAVAVVWAIAVAAEITWFALQGRALKRFALQTLLTTAAVASVFRFVSVALFGGWIAIAVTQILHAFTFGTMHSAMTVMMRQSLPANMLSRGQAIYSSVSYGAGGFIGTASAGYLVSYAGYSVLYTTCAVISTLGAAAVIYSGRWKRSTQRRMSKEFDDDLQAIEAIEALPMDEIELAASQSEKPTTR